MLIDLFLTQRSLEITHPKKMVEITGVGICVFHEEHPHSCGKPNGKPTIRGWFVSAYGDFGDVWHWVYPVKGLILRNCLRVA